ncbi:hypothetical protein SAMN02787144_105621 [Streptomyces atratus]|uniref:Uncharacterized protein n=1 Tax=Streptomyces atratus TaxID=1893 RepID=A0A1K2FB40_STRAR|nr:hypothetical protein SAMN02787144_105621 [Streptomyces atratus]
MTGASRNATEMGTVVAAVVLAIGTRTANVVVILTDTVTFLIAAAILFRWRRSRDRAARDRRRRPIRGSRRAHAG